MGVVVPADTVEAEASQDSNMKPYQKEMKAGGGGGGGEKEKAQKQTERNNWPQGSKSRKKQSADFGPAAFPVACPFQ